MDRVATNHALLLGVALGFTAGFADASTFVGADGIFCAHVTGNFVVLAADFARHAGRDQWLKLGTFPLFVVAVLGATWLRRRLTTSAASRSSRTLLTLSSALFALAATVALTSRASALDSGPVRSTVVALLVVAMAIQNAIHGLFPTLGPMTTVMTGNVTRWLVEQLLPGGPEKIAQHRQLGSTIAAFTAGCVCGAVGVAQFGFGVLLVPASLVLVGSRLSA